MSWKFFIGFVASFFLVIPIVHAQEIFTKDLRYGSKGDAVIELQEFLTDEELYAGPISGKLYSLTRTAIRKFQKREKIKQTGVWNKKTRERANKIIAARLVEDEEDDEVASDMPWSAATSTTRTSRPHVAPAPASLKQEITDWWKSLFAPRPIETPIAPIKTIEQPMLDTPPTTTPIPGRSTTTGTPFVVTPTSTSPFVSVPDTQPIVVSPSSTSPTPAITVSDITVSAITTSGATITWRTNEVLKGLDQAVVFWITPDKKYSVSPDSSGTSFSMVLRLPTGEPLKSDTNYTFVVRYPDQGVWKETYPDFFHTLAPAFTGDTTPPRISDYTVAKAIGQSPVFDWITNKLTTGVLVVGDGTYTTALNLSHLVTLGTFAVGSYPYVIRATDQNGSVIGRRGTLEITCGDGLCNWNETTASCSIDCSATGMATSTVTSTIYGAAAPTGFWHRVARLLYNVVTIPVRIIVKMQSSLARATATSTATSTPSGCTTDAACGTLVWAGATFCGSTGDPETKVMQYASGDVCQAGVCEVINSRPNVFEDCAGSGKVCGFNQLGGGTFKCVTPPGVDCRLDAAITTACKCNTVSYENYGYCCSPFPGAAPTPYHSPFACPPPPVTISPTTPATSTSTLAPTSCGSITSGGGIKAGIYLIHGYNSTIYGRTDCLADSEQQIQWVTCVEALSGTMFYPQRDNFSYSYTVKNPSGITIDSGNWTPSWITSMSSCPSNNGSGNDSTAAYNISNLQPGTAYTFTVSGTNAGGSFGSTAVFITKSTTAISTPATPSTASSPTSTPSSSTSTPISWPVSVYTPAPVTTQTPTPVTVPATTTPLWVPTSSSTIPLSFVPPAFVVTTTPVQGPPQPLTRTQARELERQKSVLVRELKTMERFYLSSGDKTTRAGIVAVRKKMQAFKAADTAGYEGMRTLEEDIADFRSNYEEAVYREEQFAAMKKQVEAFQKFIGNIEARIKQVERQKIAIDTALKETIREAKDIVKRAKKAATFEEAEDYQDQIIAVGVRLNVFVARMEQLARIPDVVRIMEKQIAEADRLVKTASSLAKRLDIGLDEAVQEIKTMVADIRGVLAAVKKNAVETDDLLGYIQENVSSKLDEVRDAVDELRALDNIRQFVNVKNADVKRYEKQISKREKSDESVDEARALLTSLKEELKALKPLVNRRFTEETIDEALTLVRSIAEMSEQLEEELRLIPADALEQQLQKLFKNNNGALGQFEFTSTAR